MPDGADFSLDEAGLDRAADRLVRGYLSAGTRAVAKTTRGLEQGFEGATKAAVRGALYKAWGSRAYPRSGGPARDPAGEVFINGGTRSKGAMQFFTSPGRVRAKDGGPIAFPLPAAGVRGRDPMMTPEKWERLHGVKLVPIMRRGRAMVLAAPGRAVGRSNTYRKIGRSQTKADQSRGYMRGEQLVPIFVIMTEVPQANTVSLAPIVSSAEAALPENFYSEVRGLGQ